MRLLFLLALLYSCPTYAGGWDDFARGFSQTSQETLERRETQQRISNATSISHDDVDFLLAEYKQCLQASPPMPEFQKAYFQKKLKAASKDKAKIEEIRQEYLTASDVIYERHRQYCSTQMERQKQAIEHQKTAQFLAQQQQEIAAQKAEITKQKEKVYELQSQQPMYSTNNKIHTLESRIDSLEAENSRLKMQR
jgi:uncharacterized protein (DUF3084 family)